MEGATFETGGAESEEEKRLENLRKELLLIEGKIDELHDKHMADPNGILFRESREVPEAWLDFMGRGEEVLNLSEEDSNHFYALMEKLLRGRLNDEEEEKNLKDLVSFKLRFEQTISSE